MAAPGEFQPISIGKMHVWPPVILAPMAGVTNYPFRTVCREFGAGLYVSEMINARPLVEGGGKSLKLADFGPGESPRSLQLYGSDPHYIAEAVKRLVGEGRIDHLDMNFGCPVPKVTRKWRWCGHTAEAQSSSGDRSCRRFECRKHPGHDQVSDRGE